MICQECDADTFPNDFYDEPYLKIVVHDWECPYCGFKNISEINNLPISNQAAFDLDIPY